MSETLQVIDLTGSDDEYDNNETTGSADVVSSKELDNPAKVGCKDKELDNSANKLDKNQTTAGTSKKGTDGLDNTAVDACPTEKFVFFLLPLSLFGLSKHVKLEENIIKYNFDTEKARKQCHYILFRNFLMMFYPCSYQLALNKLNKYCSHALCKKARKSLQMTISNLTRMKESSLTHSHTMTPFDAPWKQAL